MEIVRYRSMNNLKFALIHSLLLLMILPTCLAVESTPPQCPTSFEEALEGALRNASAPKLSAEDYIKGTPPVVFEKKNNRNHAWMMKHNLQKKIVWRVENSILKMMNDHIFKSKTIPDAVTDRLFADILSEVEKNPLLSGRQLLSQYKDAKSLEFSFVDLGDGQSAQIKKELDKIYQKAVAKMKSDADNSQLIDFYYTPRTDGLNDPANWFLAGEGASAEEANLAARYARRYAGEWQKNQVSPKPLSFQEIQHLVQKDVEDFQELAGAFTKRKSRLPKKLFESQTALHANGVSFEVPSELTLGVFRQIQRDQFPSDVAYYASLRHRFTELMGKNDAQKISDDDLKNLDQMFQVSNRLSPNLYVVNQIKIDLGKGNNGLVSVDFTGLGIQNARAQMSALIEWGKKPQDERQGLDGLFKLFSERVDEVTKEMDKDKQFFREIVGKIRGIKDPNTLPEFSGDDGMFQPLSQFTDDEKSQLISSIVAAGKSSKFRLTFVKTNYPDGTSIPTEIRSQMVVKAEKFEKYLREKIVRASDIPPEDAKKILLAIDYSPSPNGGSMNVLLPKDVSEEYRKIIQLASEQYLRENNVNGQLYRSAIQTIR